MRQPNSPALREDIDFDLLYRTHARTILRYLTSHVSLKEDAEDLLMEVFLASFRNLTRQQMSHAEQQAWLLRVARNKLADHYHLNHSGTKHLLIDEVVETLTEENISQLPEPSTLRQEEHLHLMAHIRTLNTLQQEILQLYFAYGMHSTEIAEKLNKNATTIRAILSRTLNKLRLIYEKQEV
ncbi:sigma-70 family RNA polymerase sigma factor [Ktedonobacteria bacterium brp13]|nr:sigma-70 family RNA polymerase sigma factor [Ktedonobacteria bacterium brp13]